MTSEKIHSLLLYFISLVWLVNGLVCKVLGLVPRHEQIVSRILGNDHAPVLTVTIGLSEIVMAIWILSGFKRRTCAIVQMVVIGSMNILEFMLARDLLLWGGYNSLFAFLFILLIYRNEFHLAKK